jgi:hypothetical protein
MPERRGQILEGVASLLQLATGLLLPLIEA